MKAYSITEDLSLVRYGNRLRIEVFDECIDDIDGDDVAKLIVIIRNTMNGVPWSKKDDNGRELKINFFGDRTCGIALHVSLSDDKVVVLDTPWKILKLEEILTVLLPKLSEEGL